MEKKLPEDYQVEDFITDESFFNYHFKLNTEDNLLSGNDEHEPYFILLNKIQTQLSS